MEPMELEPIRPEIELEDFQKLDLRVCQVVACEEVVKSRNFLKLTVNDGFGERTIMSTNLAPHKFCGVVSEGMLLAVDNPDEDDCKVLFAHEDCPVGFRVS